jgi:hypothetical protein
MLKRVLQKVLPVKNCKVPSFGPIPLIRSFERSGLRVQVHRHEHKNGHFEFWFVIEHSIDKWKDWFRLAALPDSQLQTVIDLLQQSLDSLDRGWKQIRTIMIRDKTYYVDDRLMQLRNVRDANDFISLD